MEIKLTPEKINVIKGFLSEISNSIVREQAEKDFRKEAFERMVREYELDKDELKILVDIHVKSERTIKRIDTMNDAALLYESIFPRDDE